MAEGVSCGRGVVRLMGGLVRVGCGDQRSGDQIRFNGWDHEIPQRALP